jgi:diacylglycerol kinase family enzyme
MAEPLRLWLAQHAVPARLEIPDTAEQSRHLIAALPSNSRIIVVGGDGTVNQLLPSLLAGSHTLALVPYGSGNDTARAWGLCGLTWQAALNHALTGRSSKVDIGLAEFENSGKSCSVPFVSSFTTGFDSSIGLRAIIGPKWLRGLPRYLLATLRELVNLRTWRVQVKLDGKLLHAGDALFASTINTRTFGGGMPAVPHARVDDGKLDILLAGKFNVFETLLMLPRLLIGRHLSHRKVKTLSFTTMQIVAETPIPLAADGEYLGMSHQLQIKVLQAGLSVVVAVIPATE